jgi:hypothetical protein
MLRGLRKARRRLEAKNQASLTCKLLLDHGPPSLNNFVRGGLTIPQCGPDPLAVELARRDGCCSRTAGNGWRAGGL